MDYKKFIIGLIIPVAAYVLALMLNNVLPDEALLALIGISGLIGLTLMVVSGPEGRLILGGILTAGTLFLFAMIHDFDVQSTQILSVITILGIVLMLSSAPRFLELDWINSLIRGGRKGIVKNLRSEGGVTSFWLEGASPGGHAIQVETNLGEGTLGEGDIVWVRGKPDGRGVIRTSEINNISRSQARNLQERSGDSELSGVVVGGIYDLKTKDSIVGGKKVELLGFRVQRIDINGNPLEIIEVEVKGDKYRSLVFDRDQVQLKGTWQSSGRLRLKEIRNLTSKTIIKLGLFS